VSRYERSGMSELAFCKKAKLSRHVFRQWKRRLAERGAPADFVEWMVPEGMEQPSAADTRFELSLPGGVVLRWKA